MSAYQITQGDDLPLEVENITDENGSAFSTLTGWTFLYILSGSPVVTRGNVNATVVSAKIQFNGLTETESLARASGVYVYQVFLTSPGGITTNVESGTVTISKKLPTV